MTVTQTYGGDDHGHQHLDHNHDDTCGGGESDSGSEEDETDAAADLLEDNAVRRVKNLKDIRKMVFY